MYSSFAQEQQKADIHESRTVDYTALPKMPRD
jgi:hypothetical protein